MFNDFVGSHVKQIFVQFLYVLGRRVNDYVFTGSYVKLPVSVFIKQVRKSVSNDGKPSEHKADFPMVLGAHKL